MQAMMVAALAHSPSMSITFFAGCFSSMVRIAVASSTDPPGLFTRTVISLTPSSFLSSSSNFTLVTVGSSSSQLYGLMTL